MSGKAEILAKYAADRTLCDNWSRVMGYYRPAVLVERIDGKQTVGSSYNIGKQSEYKERVFFQTQKSMQEK